METNEEDDERDERLNHADPPTCGAPEITPVCLTPRSTLCAELPTLAGGNVCLKDQRIKKSETDPKIENLSQSHRRPRKSDQ